MCNILINIKIRIFQTSLCLSNFYPSIILLTPEVMKSNDPKHRYFSLFWGARQKIRNCAITLNHHIRLAESDSENISNLLVTLAFGCSIVESQLCVFEI